MRRRPWHDGCGRRWRRRGRERERRHDHAGRRRDGRRGRRSGGGERSRRRGRRERRRRGSERRQRKRGERRRGRGRSLGHRRRSERRRLEVPRGDLHGADAHGPDAAADRERAASRQLRARLLDRRGTGLGDGHALLHADGHVYASAPGAAPENDAGRRRHGRERRLRRERDGGRRPRQPDRHVGQGRVDPARFAVEPGHRVDHRVPIHG